MKGVRFTAIGTMMMSTAAVAGDVETTVFSLPTAQLAIFGVQYTADFLGPATGEIVDTRVTLEFHNPGEGFDAADLIFTFQAPSEGVPVWQFTGADLGWSGSGVFKAAMSTNALNGVIDLGDPPPDFSLFFMAVQAEDFQPMLGQLVGSYYEVDILVPSSLPGDLDDDGDVDFTDLLALLAAWGDCPAEEDCPADLDDSGGVGFGDLLILLANWS